MKTTQENYKIASKEQVHKLVLKRLEERIENYKNEINRLKGVQDKYTKKSDKEYFQGHIDCLEGAIIDTEKIIKEIE